MKDYNNEELDAFLIQADLINKKVKAIAENRDNTDDIDELIQKRAEDKRRRQEAKVRREKEHFDKKVRGTEGKGITKDFCHFCRACHLQYELDTPTCLKCNRPTMSLEQRQEQLKGMVFNYKSNKSTRETKKHKWEMFQKTQAAMWKKSSNNYNQKWDYFV